MASALVYVGDTMVRAAADGKFSFEAEQADELTVMAPGYKKYVAPLNGADVGTVRLEPFGAKGVYVSGVGDLDVRQRFYELLDDTELNAIVINVKTDEGMVWTSQVPLAQEIGASYEDFYLKDFVAEAHKRGVYVIGRFTTFRDGTLPVERPDLAIKSTEGGIWSDNQGHTWSDPGNRKVWEYLGALGEEIAASGIDEIQFDYVRFPVDGDLDSVVYQTPSTRVNRPVTIESFLAYMEQRLRPQKVFISADTYGLTVWSSKEEGTGQLLVPMAKHLDYFSPMIYPDHFAAGTAGFNIPTQHPYEIIYQSVERAKTKLQGMPVLVRPFLSAFRDTQFGEPFGLEQFLAQKKAAEDAGSHGWLFWNAGLSYPDALFRQE
ncbi:MAG: putative glycoside hydrolase [Chloroflexia bacterium]